MFSISTTVKGNHRVLRICWLCSWFVVLGATTFVQFVQIRTTLKFTEEAAAAPLPPPSSSSEREGILVRQRRTLSSSSAATSTAVCAEWDQDMDGWWTHRPEWTVSLENDTHQCFSPIENVEKRKLLLQLYNTQFKGNCSKSTTKEMWSTGLGADMHNVNDGLLYALESGRPLQMWTDENGWHYAAKRDGSRPACPAKDASCYFLNISSCSARPDQLKVGPHANGFLFDDGGSSHIYQERAQWLYGYATRGKTWFRRAVYDYAKAFQIQTPCTVMHVRRADVVLHQQYSRKYHAIQEYVDAGVSENKTNILLLTDDENAIREALSQYPQHNWMYFDRPRYKGAEGGWESHIPSDDPKHELIVILSIYRHLAPKCESLIHSSSNFADFMYIEMKGAKRINIDDEKNDVYSETNSLTTNVSIGR